MATMNIASGKVNTFRIGTTWRTRLLIFTWDNPQCRYAKAFVDHHKGSSMKLGCVHIITYLGPVLRFEDSIFREPALTQLSCKPVETESKLNNRLQYSWLFVLLILLCVNKIQKALQNHISENWSTNVTNHYITLLTHKACRLFGIIFVRVASDTSRYKDSHKRELLKFIVNVTSHCCQAFTIPIWVGTPHLI